MADLDGRGEPQERGGRAARRPYCYRRSAAPPHHLKRFFVLVIISEINGQSVRQRIMIQQPLDCPALVRHRGRDLKEAIAPENPICSQVDHFARACPCLRQNGVRIGRRGETGM